MSEVRQAAGPRVPRGRRARVVQAPSRALALLGNLRGQELLWVPFAVTLAYSVFLQTRQQGSGFRHWDFLLLTAQATLILALVLVRGVPSRMASTLQRLVNRRVLDIDERGLGDVVRDLAARSTRWSRWAGAIVALVVLGAAVAALPSAIEPRYVWLAVDVVGGYVAGLQLGRMAAYGSLASVLERRGRSLGVWPGHIDGAAGVKPLGDFYFYQAMIAALPALFLAVWWFLIPFNGARYAYWRKPYLVLLVPAIIVEVLVFVVPMWAFHRQMQKARRGLIGHADELSLEILGFREHLVAATEPKETFQMKEKIEGANERYRAIADMPTWPMDLKTSRWFRASNLALLAPLISQAIGQTSLGKLLSDLVKQIQ